MSANDTIRLLIINDSRDEVERLVSMLNNAGRSIRPQYVESEEAIVKLLDEQTWDLLIAQQNSKNLPPATAIRQIKRLNRDVPVILISDEEGNQPVVEGLKLGACDVVLLDQDQHLLYVIQRELDNRENRQRRRVSDRKLREAERRGQQLLDSSRDAIAYVQDGMYLYVNQSFADRFGYADRDDMDCMPVIDMVVDEDQGKVRQFLKDFALKGDDAESCQLDVRGVGQDGQEYPLQINVAMAIFDEEDCIQFQLPSSGVEPVASSGAITASAINLKEFDPLTELYNRQHFTDLLEKEISKNLDAEATSTLFYIEIDNFFESLQAELGVGRSDQLLKKTAAFLRGKAQTGEALARFSDNAFMLLSPGRSADASLEWASGLCSAIQQQVIQLDDNSLKITASIGVAVVNENTSSSEEAISHARQAVEFIRRDFQGKGNAARLFEVEIPTDERTQQEIANQVRNALSNDRFQLMFQPIISLRGSEEEHYEILLRMQDDKGELISAHEFIKTAEKIGATAKIDRWAILESIKMLAEHRAGGHNTRVLLNLSCPSVCDDTLAPWLKVAFKAAKLNPDAVVFQIDEQCASSHINEARTFCQALKAMGSKSSLSNFGSTLNPFTTLEEVAPDYVKLHGSFTQDLQEGNESPEVLRNLVQKLLELEKVTIAPYVESASNLSTLWQTGVHYIQGHYLQAPTESMNYDFNMEG